jgi:hypothetical protein
MDLTGVRSRTTFDNVWDIDCSVFFSPTVEGRQIHSAFFDTGDTLMRELLRGIDRYPSISRFAGGNGQSGLVLSPVLSSSVISAIIS